MSANASTPVATRYHRDAPGDSSLGRPRRRSCGGARCCRAAASGARSGDRSSTRSQGHLIEWDREVAALSSSSGWRREVGSRGMSSRDHRGVLAAAARRARRRALAPEAATQARRPLRHRRRGGDCAGDTAFRASSSSSRSRSRASARASVWRLRRGPVGIESPASELGAPANSVVARGRGCQPASPAAAANAPPTVPAKASATRRWEPACAGPPRPAASRCHPRRRRARRRPLRRVHIHRTGRRCPSSSSASSGAAACAPRPPRVPNPLSVVVVGAGRLPSMRRASWAAFAWSFRGGGASPAR